MSKIHGSPTPRPTSARATTPSKASQRAKTLPAQKPAQARERSDISREAREKEAAAPANQHEKRLGWLNPNTIGCHQQDKATTQLGNGVAATTFSKNDTTICQLGGQRVKGTSQGNCQVGLKVKGENAVALTGPNVKVGASMTSTTMMGVDAQTNSGPSTKRAEAFGGVKTDHTLQAQSELMGWKLGVSATVGGNVGAGGAVGGRLVNNPTEKTASGEFSFSAGPGLTVKMGTNLATPNNSKLSTELIASPGGPSLDMAAVASRKQGDTGGETRLGGKFVAELGGAADATLSDRDQAGATKLAQFAVAPMSTLVNEGVGAVMSLFQHK